MKENHLKRLLSFVLVIAVGDRLKAALRRNMVFFFPVKARAVDLICAHG